MPPSVCVVQPARDVSPSPPAGSPVWGGMNGRGQGHRTGRAAASPPGAGADRAGRAGTAGRSAARRDRDLADRVGALGMGHGGPRLERVRAHGSRCRLDHDRRRPRCAYPAGPAAHRLHAEPAARSCSRPGPGVAASRGECRSRGAIMDKSARPASGRHVLRPDPSRGAAAQSGRPRSLRPTRHRASSWIVRRPLAAAAGAALTVTLVGAVAVTGGPDPATRRSQSTSEGGPVSTLATPSPAGPGAARVAGSIGFTAPLFRAGAAQLDPPRRERTRAHPRAGRTASPPRPRPTPTPGKRPPKPPPSGDSSG